MRYMRGETHGLEWLGERGGERGREEEERGGGKGRKGEERERRGSMS